MTPVRIMNISSRLSATERGWALSPFPESENVLGSGSDLHAVSILPGQVRGNHSHRGTDEWISIHGGAARFAWEQPGFRQTDLGPDGAFLVFIPRGVFHAFQNIGETEIVLISCFTRRPENYRDETEWKELLAPAGFDRKDA
jgi:oxalate decarboxylase/phosphoglucose isomerase-like protein (cupin superfamily)